MSVVRTSSGPLTSSGSHPGCKAARWSQSRSELSIPSPSSPLQVENPFAGSCDMVGQKPVLRTDQNKSTESQHVCDQCGKTFQWPSHLAQHCQQIHTGSKAARRGPDHVETDNSSPLVPVPEPLQAENIFCQKSTLLIDQSTQTENLHICIHSEKEFRWPSDLAQHHLVLLRSKTASQVQEPESCSPRPLVPAPLPPEEGNMFTSSCETFPQSSLPKADQSTQTNGLHHCDLCGKDFQWPSPLVQHQLVHSGEKVTQKDLLRLEEYSSSPLVPAPLQAGTENSCKAPGRNSDLMIADQSMHTKNLYHCNLCGKDFRWPSALARHCRYMHSRGEAARGGLCQSEACNPLASLPVLLKAENMFGDSCETFRQACMQITDWSTCTENLHVFDQCEDFRWLSKLTQLQLVQSSRGGQCQSKVNGSDPLISSPILLQVDSSFTNSHQTFSHGSQSVTEQHAQFKKSHTCNQCGKSFQRLSNFARHKCIHSGGKLQRRLPSSSQFKTSYICGTCGKSFRYPSDLARHERSHSKRRLRKGQFSLFKTSYICSQCGKSFPWPSDCARHERIHFRGKNQTIMPSGPTTGNQHAQIKQPYLCDQCGQGFQQLSDFSQHMYTHSEQRPYTCAVCGCRFKRYVQLKKHQNRHEKSHKEDNDDDGGQRQQHVLGEDVSMENTPTEQVPCLLPSDSGEYCQCLASLKACECGECHLRVHDSSELLPRKRIWEAGSRDHSKILSLMETCECGYCGNEDSSFNMKLAPLKVDIAAGAELTPTWSSLEMVINKPTVLSASSGGHQNVTCMLQENTSLASTTASSLGYPPAIASQSPQGSPSLSSPLWFMERASLLAGEDKPCTCPICPKRFSVRSYLTKHLHTHREGKPYRCPTCKKCFAQRSYLTKHQRVHTTKLSYECTVCGSLFTQLSYLRKHTRVHRR